MVNQYRKLVKVTGPTFAAYTPTFYVGDSYQVAINFIDDNHNYVDFSMDSVAFGFGEELDPYELNSGWEHDDNFTWKTIVPFDTTFLTNLLGTNISSLTNDIEARVSFRDGTIQSFLADVTFANVVIPPITDRAGLFEQFK